MYNCGINSFAKGGERVCQQSKWAKTKVWKVLSKDLNVNAKKTVLSVTLERRKHTKNHLSQERKNLKQQEKRSINNTKMAPFGAFFDVKIGLNEKFYLKFINNFVLLDFLLKFYVFGQK